MIVQVINIETNRVLTRNYIIILTNNFDVMLKVEDQKQIDEK